MVPCPKCKAEAKYEMYMDVRLIVCEECGYDESAEYEVLPEDRPTQRGKGRYTPYKTGGPARTAKKRR